MDEIMNLPDPIKEMMEWLSYTTKKGRQIKDMQLGELGRYVIELEAALSTQPRMTEEELRKFLRWECGLFENEAERTAKTLIATGCVNVKE